jgi:cytosine permease
MEEEPMTLGLAASLIVGTFIVGATMFPDLCRYARSARDAALGSAMAFAVGFPLVLAFAALPSIATGEADLMKVITALGMAVSGVIMLVFATWTTNAYNLYSATLAFAPIFRRIDRWMLVIAISIVGTGIALLGILDHFMQWVGFLAVAVPPVAGVYVADFLIFSRHERDLESGQQSGVSWPAFAAWAIGVAVANLANQQVIHLTAMPAIDGILSATISFSIIRSMGSDPHNRLY